MYINKLIKKQVLLASISVFLIAIIVFGSSFAFFETSKSSTNDQTIAVGELNIFFNGGAEINNNNLKPMNDDIALDQTDNIYTFSITNNGTLDYTYDISLINNPEYLEGGNNFNASRSLLDLKYLRYQLNSETIKNVQTKNPIYSGVIAPNETQNFTLRIWLEDAEEYLLPNEVLESEVHMNIVVDGKVGNEDEEETPTGPSFKEILLSNDNNNMLKSAPDDYGTSYYFEGDVDNNYVEFANMCWKVLRTTGNDAVKIILSNNNGLSPNNSTPSSSNPCNATYVNNSEVANLSDNQYRIEFNSSSTISNGLIGLKYGTLLSSSYTAEHANVNNSDLLNELNEWYESVLATQTDFNDELLADVIWCNDKTIATGSGYANNITKYGSYDRIYDENPSLICATNDNIGKLSKFTVLDQQYGNATLDYKIGIMTADEALCALGNNWMTSFLTKGLRGNYWTLTPARYNSANSYPEVHLLYYDYDYDDKTENWYLEEEYVNHKNSIRPVIALSSNVTATGTGTTTDPYKIVQ